jgi:hypothetical protein
MEVINMNKTKYLFINTWNGAGHSESDIEIHNTLETIHNQVHDVCDYQEIELTYNSDKNIMTTRFRHKDDWGCHHYEPLKDDVIAVVIFPNINEWELITNNNTLEEYKNIVRIANQEEEDYDEGEEIPCYGYANYDNFCHEIDDSELPYGDCDLILCEV